MTIHECGKDNKQIVVLIHPSGVMWDYFEYVIPLMEERYHLIVPALPGYDEDRAGDFTSVEEIAAELAYWLIDRGYKEIACIYGCSMGGAVVTRFISDDRVKVENAVIDGGITPYQLPWIATRFIAVRDFLLIYAGKLGGLKLLEKAFSTDEYSDEDLQYVYKVLQFMSLRTIWRTFESCNNYKMPDRIHTSCGHIEYWYSSAEKKDRKWDVEYIRKNFPQTEFRIFEDLGHGGLAALKPELLAEEIERLITGEKRKKEKYRIEKDSIQETLMIPLIGRKVCSDHFPELFSDPEADRILNMLDCDLGGKLRKMETAPGLFGALEVAQRQYDLGCEVRDYLKDHPKAAVVNMGCGLDDTFRKCDNGTCKGYNIDMPDVIEVRNALLPAGEREQNIAHDLNDFAWMDMIDASGGAVFYASGVFYYFRESDIQKLFASMSDRFPGAVLVFDCCNSRGARMMTGTWIKEAGIKDVKALFSLEDASEILSWKGKFRSVTSRSYMRGYRDICSEVSRFHRLMIWFCDKLVKMVIIKVAFNSCEKNGDHEMDKEDKS